MKYKVTNSVVESELYHHPILATHNDGELDTTMLTTHAILSTPIGVEVINQKI